MKKMYMLAFPLAFGMLVNSASAQTTIDFEELIQRG
jgi:hypothetical protein